MNYKNEIEQELVFQVEIKDNKEKQTVKHKKVIKIASENVKKLMKYKLNGRTGEC